jgi:hypothetical protein
MQDPVILSDDGNSYEKKAIEEWLTNNNYNPINYCPLSRYEVVPNNALKSLIEEFIVSQKYTPAKHADTNQPISSADMKRVRDLVADYAKYLRDNK